MKVVLLICYGIDILLFITYVDYQQGNHVGNPFYLVRDESPLEMSRMTLTFLDVYIENTLSNHIFDVI